MAQGGLGEMTLCLGHTQGGLRGQAHRLGTTVMVGTCVQKTSKRSRGGRPGLCRTVPHTF